MLVVNVVEKFDRDEALERSWNLPLDVVEPLRAHVDLTPEGWIMGVWPVTLGIVKIVQPWIDEVIDVESGAWFVSSVRPSP